MQLIIVVLLALVAITAAFRPTGRAFPSKVSFRTRKRLEALIFAHRRPHWARRGAG